MNAAGWTFKGEEETEDMYTSVDKVMDKVERQIRKVKGREQAKKGPGAETAREAVEQIEQGGLGVSEAVLANSEEAETAKGGSTEASDGS